VTRTELEALARRYMGASTRLDGLGDKAAKLVIMKAAIPGATVSTATSAAYLDAALDELAGKRPTAERTDAGPARALRTDVVSEERAPGAPTSAPWAFQAMRRDAENAWRTPLRATRDHTGAVLVHDAGEPCTGPRAALPSAGTALRGEGGRTAAAAPQVGDAAAARARMIADAEDAWRHPSSSASTATDETEADA
jgi:hypothetical protein